MKPRVFVGSSLEGLSTANAIHQSLENDAEVTVWDQDIYALSSFALLDLLSALDTQDFGVFVLSPDDMVRIRGRKFVAARDNVLFELGLFIGRLGRERTFLVMPKGQTDFRIATDLVGLHPASFDPDRSDGNLRAAVGPACNSIRNRIRQVGPLPRASKKGHELSGPTLLVADDDMKDGDLIFKQIRRLVGRRAGLLLLNDPVEACELLRTDAPVIGCITDMVFRDHSPLSGVQIAEAANRRGLPVIIATSHMREHLGLAIAELSRIGIPESSIL